MTPLQATYPTKVNLVLFNSHKNDKYNINNPKFNVGDRVRINSYKSKFDRDIRVIGHERYS